MDLLPRPLFIFAKMSWYATAVCGGFVGSGLVIVLRKNIIYVRELLRFDISLDSHNITNDSLMTFQFICAATLAISSLIFIIWYDEYIAIIVGRCVAGFGT